MEPSVIIHVRCTETECTENAVIDCDDCGWPYCDKDFQFHVCTGQNPFKKIKKGICLERECKQETGAIECDDCGWQFCLPHFPEHVCDPAEVPF